MLDAKLFADGPRMICGHDHDEVIPRNQFECEPAVLQPLFWAFDKTEFDGTVYDGIDNLGRVADGHHQSDTGIGMMECDQSRWQEMACDRLARLDLETPAGETRELAHRELYGVRAVNERARFVEEQFASFRHKDAASDAVKEFRAEFTLE